MLTGPSLVLRGGLRLGDALALPLQHDLALPRCDARQDRQHELAGRVAGIQSLALLYSWTTRPTPRFDRSASMASSSAVLRASRSGLVTVRASPSRRKGEALVEFRPLRHAGHLFAEYLLRPRGLQVALLPAAKPAAVWSQVDVRAYPTIIARRPLCVLLAFTTSCGMASESRGILLGRDFRDF